MTTDPSTTSSRLKMESGSIVKSTPVVVNAVDYIYSGHIVHFSEERLLDVLNQGSVGDQPDLPADFLGLHNVTICSVEGKKETISSNCLIGKRGILFVGERKDAKVKVSDGIKNRSKLFIQKKAVCVEVHEPSLFIIGQMYIEPWQRLTGAFNDGRMFLPLTNVIVLSRSSAKVAEFEFVAVNRDQINYIAKMDY